MRSSLASLTIVALATGASAQAWAADIYVDAAAAAGGDGTAGAPLQEVQAGLDAAMAGDTVHVAAGMYGPIRTVRAGTEDAPISVVADAPRSAIIQGAGSALEYAHDWHRFEGLVIDGGYGGGDAVLGDGGNHIAFVGVEVRRSGRDCFDLRNSTDILIERSFIHHCVFNDGGTIEDAHGVTGDSVFDLTIRDTEIAMASGDSVQLSPPREPWGNVVIEGCLLWTAPLDDADAGLALDTPMGENAFDSKVGPELDGNGANPRVLIRDTIAHGFVGFIDNQAAFLLKEDVDATVDRVTIYDSDLGFRLRGPAVVRVQNAVVHSVDHVLRYEDGITGVVLANTTIGGGITSELFEDGGGGGWAAPVIDNLLVLDVALPADANAASSMMVGADVFIDANAHDYRLVEGSAPIDAGVALAEVTEDRTGVMRPYGEGYDIGAHEWNPDTGGDTGDDGDGSATGVDDSGSADDDGTAGEGGSATADDGVDAATDGMGTVGDGESGSGSSGENDEDGGGCSCRSSQESSRGAAWFLLIAFAARARRRGRARGTPRDRTADDRASRSR